MRLDCNRVRDSSSSAQRQLTIDRFIRSLENQLIEREIEPTAELESGVPDCACVRETELFVKCDAATIGEVYRSNHYVILLISSGIDQLPHERKPDAFASVVR